MPGRADFIQEQGLERAQPIRMGTRGLLHGIGGTHPDERIVANQTLEDHLEQRGIHGDFLGQFVGAPDRAPAAVFQLSKIGCINVPLTSAGGIR